MAQPWQTVRIFISSTFRDMQAERDHLVRFVFPELRERCAKQRLHLVDVDLRWGVTEEEAERGKVLEVCLDEIERCRPFFVGLLGERYGWTPTQYTVPGEPRYDWVRGLESGHSITALEIYHGVLRNPAVAAHAFFYFRDPGFVEAVPEVERERYLPESPEAAEKLKRLKADIRKHCRVAEYAGPDEAFGQRVLEDLWAAISQKYPEEEKLPDELAVERAYHEAFIESRTQRFVGRGDVLRKLTEHADGDERMPLLVVGAPGSGKSAVLAKFAREYAEAHSEAFVLSHLIGVSPGSTDIRRTLLRLCREIARRFDIADEIPEEYEALRVAFLKLIEKVPPKGKVVLILDALDQLEDTHRSRTLGWLPYSLPSGLRLIVSTLEGDCLDALRRRKPALPEIVVGPLPPDNRREIVRQTLWEYRKRLEETPGKDQMALLMEKAESERPLYLIVACEELRVLGEFERVPQRIASLPADIPSLSEQVLERLEHDHGRELARNALSLLACSRHGLLETEMLDLLRRQGEEQLPRAIWARLYRSLQFYLRPPGETGEGLLNFFHQQLAQAVRHRYLASDEVTRARHRTLAEYFHRKADPAGTSSWTGNYPRGLSELTYHLTCGALWDQMYGALTSFDFLEARCTPTRVAAGEGVHELLCDFDFAISRWQLAAPDADRRETIRAIVVVVRREHPQWREYPRLLFQQIFPHLWWLRSASDSVQAELRRLCSRHLPIYTARGWWIRRLDAPAANPSFEFQLSVPESPLTCLVFAGRQAFVGAGTQDGHLVVWELDTMRRIAIALEGGAIRAVAVSGEEDRCCFVAVCESGRFVSVDPWGGQARLLFRSLSCVGAAAFFSADGLAAVGNALGQLELWDMQTHSRLASWAGRRIPITQVAFCGDGSRLMAVDSAAHVSIYDCRNPAVRTSRAAWHGVGVVVPAAGGEGWWVGRNYGAVERVEDLAEGPKSLAFHPSESFYAAAVSASGRRLALGSSTGVVLVWDLKAERSQPASFHLDGPISSLVFSRDGEWIVAASEVGNCEVHRVAALQPHGKDDTLKAVTRPVYTPSGQSRLFGSPDGLLQVLGEPGDSVSEIVSKGFGFRRDLRCALAAPFVAAAGGGGNWQAWELRFGAERGNMGAAGTTNAVAVSPAGDIVVTGYDNGRAVAWDLETGAERGRFPLHDGGITSLVFTPDGSRLISAGEDGFVKAWRLAASRTHPRGEKTSTYAWSGLGTGTLAWVALSQEWATSVGARPWALALSRDGALLACSADDSICLLLPTTGELSIRRRDAPSGWLDVDFSPDCSLLLGVSVRGTCCLWRVEDLKPVARFHLPAGALGASWRPDGSEFAVTTREGEFLLFTTEGVWPGPPVAPVLVGDGGQRRTQCPRPRCARPFEIASSSAGAIVSCPHCAGLLRLGPPVRFHPRFESDFDIVTGHGEG